MAVDFINNKIENIAKSFDITHFDTGPAEQAWDYSQKYKYWPKGQPPYKDEDQEGPDLETINMCCWFIPHRLVGPKLLTFVIGALGLFTTLEAVLIGHDVVRFTDDGEPNTVGIFNIEIDDPEEV